MEIQGVVFDHSYMYLITTTSIWAVALGSGVIPKKIITSETDTAARAVVDQDGLHYEGRKQTFHPGESPHHLSAPCLYQGKLVVPAEGVPATIGDRRWQWLWIFDTNTLGYLGRIGLPVDESGLEGMSWAYADPESSLLYTSVGDNAADVKVFEMPDLDGFVGPPADQMAIRVDKSGRWPTVFTKFLGRVPLLEPNGKPHTYAQINGGVVTTAGHLYVCSRDDGIRGFDLLTGRRMANIPVNAAGLTAKLQGIDFDPLRKQIHVAIWIADMPWFRDSDYSIMHLQSEPVDSL